MIANITTKKVAIPASLFLALSPGLLLTANGKSIKFRNGLTNQTAILFHALVFFLVYAVIAKALGLVLTRTDLLVTTALFVILSPGLLLTLPPGSGGVFRSGQTSLQSVLLHTVVYALIFALLRKQFPQFY